MKGRPGDGPVAVVTGAGRGIGRYLSERLLTRGYRVVGCSRSPADWEHDAFEHLRVDVTEEEQVTALFRGIRKRYGRLDAVINNAGAATMNPALLTAGPVAHQVVATNLLGTFLVSREGAKLMRPGRSGRIVNFGTAAGPLRLAGEAIYVASKCAVVALSQVLAREVAEFGITVNVVAPGPVATEMLRGVPTAAMEALVATLPLRRMTELADVANVVEFFLAPESRGVTGQVIYLSGVSAG